MVLDLPGDADVLWDRFRAKVRNQVRKARKSGLTTQWAGPDRLADFHRVYATNMRDLGSPPHAQAFHHEILTRFGDVAKLLLVCRRGRTIAGALVLRDPACWQVPWASSLREHNGQCPSHLMYWTILEAACGQTPRFCFGRSGRDSGTYRFKAQWGAREAPLLWRTWMGDADPSDEPGRVVSLVQRAWRRIPVPLARALGPHIIRCGG